MKFSTVVSLLVVSPAIGFIPSHVPNKATCLGSSYLENLEMESQVENKPLRSPVGIPGEDAETTALAASLGIDDVIIRQVRFLLLFVK